MREYKFRGKRLDNGEWAYGWLLRGISGRAYIIELVDDVGSWKNAPRLLFIEVDPTSVGQFSGLCDKNKKEIYEGDVVACDLGNGPYVSGKSQGTVSFAECSFEVHDTFLFDLSFKKIQVIGNIHDPKPLN